jgi:hypothetical protein
VLMVVFLCHKSRNMGKERPYSLIYASVAGKFPCGLLPATDARTFLFTQGVNPKHLKKNSDESNVRK